MGRRREKGARLAADELTGRATRLSWNFPPPVLLKNYSEAHFHITSRTKRFTDTIPFATLRQNRPVRMPRFFETKTDGRKLNSVRFQSDGQTP